MNAAELKKIEKEQRELLKLLQPGGQSLAGGITGLWLIPGSKAGQGRWILRYVSPITGKRRDMGLGSFPDVSLAKAREKAQAGRAQMQSGNDPIEIKRKDDGIPTFEQAARKHWEILAPTFRNVKHKAQWISSLEMHVFPEIGSVRVDKLDTDHFAAVFNRLIHKIPETTKRIKSRCSVVMASCRAKRLITSNPLADIDALLATKRKDTHQAHQPAMPWQRVPEFVSNHLAVLGGGAKACLLFVILTACRSGEARGAMWSEIDFDNRLWVVPAARMKANRSHRVPLSSHAVDLIKQQARLTGGEGLVFPALRAGELSDMALTAILRKANAISDVPGRVATAHGFRTSFRNWCADNGVSHEIAERALAHTIGNKVQAAYERTDRLEARVQVMQAWSNFITGERVENVVQFPGRVA